MNTYETALAWRAQGISVIPICAMSKTPALPSWMPYTERLPTHAEIAAWFQGTAYNIAVITGGGLVILDWDDMGAYDVWRASLNGTAPLAETFTVRTARGMHLYYRVDAETRTAHGDGWDVKGHHGYCLTFPSTHPSGARYKIAKRLPLIALPAIDVVLPAYAAAIEEQEREQARARDPLAAAMRTTASDIDGPVDWDALKARVSWESLLTGVTHRGSRTWGCCPFHGDDHPSLMIYPDNHYHCFVCGAHGRDQIDLYAAIHNLTIGEAITELSE